MLDDRSTTVGNAPRSSSSSAWCRRPTWSMIDEEADGRPARGTREGGGDEAMGCGGSSDMRIADYDGKTESEQHNSPRPIQNSLDSIVVILVTRYLRESRVPSIRYAIVS